MKPMRIQRRRSKGWRMPEGAIYVGRPTIFGNPWRVEQVGQIEAVEYFRRWLIGDLSGNGVAGGLRRVTLLARLGELRGHDLACWCPIVNRFGVRIPCHADVLLELSNDGVSDAEKG